MAGEKLFTGASAFDLAGNKEVMRFSNTESLKAIVNYKPPKAIEDVQKKFDPVKIPPIVVFKSVVVSQDPAADQVVPAGTEVKVTMVSKGSLPVGSFQASPAILAKYATADLDLVLTDLTEKGQAVTPILASEKGYDALSPAEKQAVGQYATSIGLQLGGEADTKAAFEDLQLFHNF